MRKYEEQIDLSHVSAKPTSTSRAEETVWLSQKKQASGMVRLTDEARRKSEIVCVARVVIVSRALLRGFVELYEYGCKE